MTIPEEYRRIWLPYAVIKMKDKHGGWLPLNRGYKPLGMPLDQWVEYETIPKAMRIKEISLTRQQKIHHGNEQCAPWRPNEIIWLYNDTSIPTSSKANWNFYQQRLFLLSQCKCFGENS